MYYINNNKGDKRLDVALKEFDKKWHEDKDSDKEE
tara:strand:- start:1835 stop:1939 length:105 start_codon:yes stop_codon:yes gene_type:complete